MDQALLANKPFAVVPCCVFPNFNTQRRRPCGGAVKTHEHFCEYLLSKHSCIRHVELPFEGESRLD